MNRIMQNSKAAIYMRVSSDEQRERQTIETQRVYAEQYTAMYKLDVFRTYADDGASGTIPLANRPVGAELMADAQAGKFDTLYVYRIDRLARSTIEVLRIVEHLEDMGVKFVSMSEPGIDTGTPSGKMILTMLAAAAQHERDSLVERSELGMRRAAALRHMGGRPSYGYRIENGQWVVCEPEAQAIREMFLAYIAGESTYSVARELTARGIPAPISDAWVPGTIIKFLRNEAYAGRRAWRKRHLRRQRDGSIVSQKADSDLWIWSDCPAIITREVWDAAQKKRRENSKYTGRNCRRTYLLRGKIECGICGYSFVGHTALWTMKNGERQEYVHYYCGSKTTSSSTRGQCDSLMLSGTLLEEIVWQEIVGFLKRPAGVVKQLEAQKRTDEHRRVNPEREIARVDKALNQQATARKRLIDALAAGAVSQSDIADKLQKIEALVESLNEEKQALLEKAVAASTYDARINDAGEMLRRLSDSLNSADRAAQARLVRLLVDKIIITTGFDETKKRPRPHAEVHYNFGTEILADCEYSGNSLKFRK